MNELESIIAKTITKAEYSYGGSVLTITFNDGSTFTVEDGMWDGFTTRYEDFI